MLFAHFMPAARYLRPLRILITQQYYLCLLLTGLSNNFDFLSYCTQLTISELLFASVSKRVFESVTIHTEMCSAYRFIFMQIKFISF